MLVYHYARVSALDKAGDIKFRILTYYIADLPFRDHRETMERPFFSLSKRKRLRPIDYQSPDGRVWIKVSPHGEHGMATIWDADILIWATSQILERCRRGEPMQRVIAFRPNELLRAIGRVYNASGCAGGKSYVELKAALDRLKNTNIRTNIRVLNGNRLRRDEGSFSWIDEWRYVEAEGEAPLMEFELSRWVYEGILQRGGVLAIERSIALPGSMPGYRGRSGSTSTRCTRRQVVTPACASSVACSRESLDGIQCRATASPTTGMVTR
jgi:plasmid replication initiation protein